MQRKCKTCGTASPLGMSDPHGKERWIATACADHFAAIERDWLKWCAGNGRPVLPTQYRHPENRSLDFGARGQGDKQNAQGRVHASAHEPSQKGFDL